MIAKEQLVGQLGPAFTSNVVERLHRFAYVPPKVLSELAGASLGEEWGHDNYVLRKYLAVHVAWAAEQGRFTQNEKQDQVYMTAGHLQTRYGTPLFLVFQKIDEVGKSPWRLVAASPQVSAPELPMPPDIPEGPHLTRGLEIVMSHDHILGDRYDRVSFLRGTPKVAQMCAVAGAIQWALNRGLQLRHWYFGQMSYLVPLYLNSREDITKCPDLIAPIQVGPSSLLVRTVLEPHMPYPNARVAVQRHDQLPPWLLAAWAAHVATGGVELKDDESEATNS